MIGLNSAPLFQLDDEVLYQNEEGWIVVDISESGVGGWHYQLNHLDGRDAINVHEGELE